MSSINKTLLISFLAIFILMVFSISLWQGEKKERERLEINLSEYGKTISTLTLSNQEIKTELDKNNQALTETDSILKSKNKRISQLESLIATHVAIRDTDTIYVQLKPEPIYIPSNPVVYKNSFSDTSNCITVSGFVLSTDSMPSVALTERSADIKIYDIRIKRKWWQIFKPKEERIVESSCGEIEILTINKKR